MIKKNCNFRSMKILAYTKEKKINAFEYMCD